MSGELELNNELEDDDGSDAEIASSDSGAAAPADGCAPSFELPGVDGAVALEVPGIERTAALEEGRVFMISMSLLNSPSVP